MLEIEYPTPAETEACKAAALRAALSPKRVRGPGARAVFHNCGAAAFISLLLYALLWAFCASLKSLPPSKAGIAVLGAYPLSYFAFCILSVFSEEQCETVELKTVMKYPHFYIAALRMLYISVAAILLDLGLVAAAFRAWGGVWHLCAAGTAFTLLLALAGMGAYRRYGSAAALCVPPALWVVMCVLLMHSAAGPLFYRLIIERIPLAVHAAVAAGSLGVAFAYVGKVGVRYAYS